MTAVSLRKPRAAKSRVAEAPIQAESKAPVSRVGRPKKAKMESGAEQAPKKRGRPKGSKNRPKEALPHRVIEPAIASPKIGEIFVGASEVEEADLKFSKVRLRPMTVNVPEDVINMFMLHAERRYETLTSIVKEAMVEYLRTHDLPPRISMVFNAASNEKARR